MNWKWHEKTAEKFARLDARIEEKFSRITNKHSLTFFIFITIILSTLFSLSFFLLPRYDTVFFDEFNWNNLALSEKLRPYCAAVQCLLLVVSFGSWVWTIVKSNNHFLIDMFFLLLGLFPILPTAICVCWLALIFIKNKKKIKNEQSDSGSSSN